MTMYKRKATQLLINRKLYGPIPCVKFFN